MGEKIYCLFSLSREDEAFSHANLADAKKWLITEKKAEKPYLFAKKSPKRVKTGAILLFSFDAQVFGMGTAKTDVQTVSIKEQETRRKQGKYVYEHSIVLEGKTVELLQNTVTKKRITKQLGIEFGQVFRCLTEHEYDEILKMSK